MLDVALLAATVALALATGLLLLIGRRALPGIAWRAAGIHVIGFATGFADLETASVVPGIVGGATALLTQRPEPGMALSLGWR